VARTGVEHSLADATGGGYAFQAAGTHPVCVRHSSCRVRASDASESRQLPRLRRRGAARGEHRAASTRHAQARWASWPSQW
jgi:hypothetical protein